LPRAFLAAGFAGFLTIILEISAAILAATLLATLLTGFHNAK